MLQNINLSAKPGKDDIILEFTFNPHGRTIEQASDRAAEIISRHYGSGQSKGLHSSKIRAPFVFDIDHSSGRFFIAVDTSNIEHSSISQIAALGNDALSLHMPDVRFRDALLPRNIQSQLPGPKYGSDALFDYLKKQGRPILAGVNINRDGPGSEMQHIFDMFVGGCDAVIDDRRLSSVRHNGFAERIAHASHLKDKAERMTGERKLYIPNITSGYKEMLARAGIAEEKGCRAVAIDTSAAGLSAIDAVREHYPGLMIYAYADMGRQAFAGSSGSRLFTLKLNQLAGADIVEMGVSNAGSFARANLDPKHLDLRHISEYYKTKGVHKPSLIALSGELYPHTLHPHLSDAKGAMIIAQDSIHSHPSGAIGGAKAMKGTIDAFLSKTHISKAAENCVELSKALMRWG